MPFLDFKRHCRYFTHTILHNPTYSAALLANKLYAFPFYCGPTLALEWITVVVTVAKAGSLIRLGIYENLASVHPGALLVDSGDLSGATTGRKENSFTYSFQADKLYWLSIISNNTPSVRSVHHNWLVTSPFGLQSDLGTTEYNCWLASQAYGPLPDPFPAADLTSLEYGPAVFLWKFCL